MDSDIETGRDSDESILHQVAQGDERALSRLYDRFAPPLLGLLRQMLGDEHEAEDVLQEGFVYLWNKAATYDAAKSKAFTWTVMIFRHKAIDRLRARGRRTRLDEQAAEEAGLWSGQTGPQADDAAEEQDRAVLVRQALHELPAPQRKLIELAFIKGLTHHDIADTLGLPLGSVKTSIRRGLQRLRELLKGSAG
jgi:RNA polymerase sigma-70 factor (ECF subfamily)